MPGYERTEYYQPSRINAGGAAVYGTVVDKLREFSARTAAVAETIALPRARQAGAEAGAAGDRQLRSPITSVGRAYNEGLLRSYAGTVIADTEVAASRIESDAVADPGKFKAVFSAMARSTLEHSIPEARGALSAYLGSRQAEGLIRLNKQAAAKFKEEQYVDGLRGIEALTEAAGRKLALADPAQHADAEKILTTIGDQIQSMQNVGLLSPKEAYALQLKSRDDALASVQKARIEGPVNTIMAAARKDVAAIPAALAQLDSMDLDPEERDKIRQQVRQQTELLRFERREAYVKELEQLNADIATRDVTPDTGRRIDELFHRGALTPSESASLHEQYARAWVDKHADEAVSAEIEQLLASGVPLDPANAAHRTFLEQSFGHDTQHMPSGSPTWQAVALSYAGRARMLPTQATAWARQAMRSPEVGLAANAAQFLGAVRVAAPDAVSGFDESTRAFAGTVNGMIESGTTPQRAVETAREIVFNTKPELVERRKAEYTVAVKDSDKALSTLIDRDFGAGWFHSDPTATAGLSTDFSSQASRYYAKTGDIALARDLAWQDLKRVYGVSHVNGTGQVMAFPVERFGVRPEDVRTDLSGFLKGNPQADGSGSADILLVPDALTLRAAADALTGESVRPSYKLVTKTGDLVLDHSGIPKRFTVPTGEGITQRIQAAQEAAVATAQLQIAQARADRAAREEFQRELLAGELH